MQKKLNSVANTLELCLFYIEPSISQSMKWQSFFLGLNVLQYPINTSRVEAYSWQKLKVLLEDIVALAVQ